MMLIAIFLIGIALVKSEDDSLKKYSNGNLKFSANVYKELLKTNSGNILVCPMSVETVFALVHAGTAGSSASQISAGFHFAESAKEIQDNYKQLSPFLQHSGLYNLSSANKIYIKNQFKIKDEYKTVAVNTFNSEIQEIDFDKKAHAVKEINKWVEEQTYEKIKDMLSESDIDEFTRIILINAMYFKANWVHKFSKDITQKRQFYLNKDKSTEVETMEITKHFKYYECSKLNLKYLEMDFEGGDISMTFILPNDKEGLSAIEDHLEDVLKVPEFSWEKVHVRLPKYKIESKIDLIPILKKLGVVDVFDEAKADLSGFVSDPNIRLVVNKVIQKAFIEVEEDGTTAAAATAVIIAVVVSAIIEPIAEPKEFIADHPFFFILRHKFGIMFVGRYNGN